MVKRFYDSEKFDDPWYRRLTPIQKCFWEYLLCKCNHAGIWKVDFDLASFCIGTPITEKDCEFLDGRVNRVNNKKWFIEKFILYQQKIKSLEELNPKNPCHRSILNKLIDEGLLSPLLAPTEPLASPIGKGNSKGKGNEGAVVWDDIK